MFHSPTLGMHQLLGSLNEENYSKHLKTITESLNLQFLDNEVEDESGKVVFALSDFGPGLSGVLKEGFNSNYAPCVAHGIANIISAVKEQINPDKPDDENVVLDTYFDPP